MTVRQVSIDDTAEFRGAVNGAKDRLATAGVRYEFGTWTYVHGRSKGMAVHV